MKINTGLSTAFFSFIFLFPNVSLFAQNVGKLIRQGADISRTMRQTVQRSLLQRYTAHSFTRFRLNALRNNFVPKPLPEVKLLVSRKSLTRMEVLDVQTQIFYGEWATGDKEMLLLKDLPSLTLAHGFSVLPSFQVHAVKFYRNGIKEYAGAEAFFKEEDFTAWGKTMAAVSNLGFWGTEKDAGLLVSVYGKVPASARGVTALTVMRALLSLGAADAAASFARVAAQDGALSDEFALGFENQTEAFVEPTSQELEKMYRAATDFHPVNALHFDPSLEATAKWLSYKNDIQKASPVMDLAGMSRWQEKQVSYMTPEELRQMLSGTDNPVYEGMDEATIQYWVTTARQEWVRRFQEKNPGLTKGIAREELTPWADYTRYDDPEQALADWLRKWQAKQKAEQEIDENCVYYVSPETGSSEDRVLDLPEVEGSIDLLEK